MCSYCGNVPTHSVGSELDIEGGRRGSSGRRHCLCRVVSSFDNLVEWYFFIVSPDMVQDFKA